LLGESYVIRVGSDPVALVILGERPTRQPIAWPYWPMMSPIECGLITHPLRLYLSYSET
jgi:hypothetical protein